MRQTFLMEFVDAQRVANNSPPCTFTPDPPLELRSIPGPAGLRPIGYLSLGEWRAQENGRFAWQPRRKAFASTVLRYDGDKNCDGCSFVFHQVSGARSDRRDGLVLRVTT